MRNLLTKHQPVVLIEIQPFFLKGFGIEEADLMQLIGELGYELYLYDQGSKKLSKYTTDLIDSNYLMISRATANEYADIIG